jgi:hypothetical protein
MMMMMMAARQGLDIGPATRSNFIFAVCIGNDRGQLKIYCCQYFKRRRIISLIENLNMGFSVALRSSRILQVLWLEVHAVRVKEVFS